MFNGEPWNYLVHPKRLIGVDDVNGGMVFEKNMVIQGSHSRPKKWDDQRTSGPITRVVRCEGAGTPIFPLQHPYYATG